MFENLGKEISAIESNKNKDSFDPDKRINTEIKKDTPLQKINKIFNPDLRLKPDNFSGLLTENDNRQLIDGGSRFKNDIEIGALSPKERDFIKNEKGWSDAVIDYIDNMKQYEDVYKDAHLKEVKVNNRTCLVKDNLDLDYVDPKTNKTNKELMQNGRNPYDATTGERIELHHMNQKADSPFAELTKKSEHDGNHATLHPSKEPSWRKTDPDADKKYNQEERPNHWIKRAEG